MSVKENKKLKTAAVIAECNPFHCGHEYLIRTVREETGADRVLLLLSGDYVQRGVPALTDRHVRTEMALRGGTDLVLAYPTRYATASAENFASYGVRILEALQCADFLVFGSESGDLKELSDAAAFFETETESYKTRLQQLLKEGADFAKARSEAAGEFGSLVSSSNNILAVEYLKALRKYQCSMKPYTIRRKTENSENASARQNTAGNNASASKIRTAIEQNRNLTGIEKQLPENAMPVLLKDIEKYGIVTEDDFSLLLHEKLLGVSSPEELTHFQGVSGEMAASFYRGRNTFSSFRIFSEEMHTKNRIRASVNRALLHIALGIPEYSDLNEDLFVQILGFRKESASLLKDIKERSMIPVVAKAADAAKILSPGAYEVFREELRCCDLYNSIRARKACEKTVPEIARSIIRI